MAAVQGVDTRAGHAYVFGKLARQDYVEVKFVIRKGLLHPTAAQNMKTNFGGDSQALDLPSP